jgi:ferredoxin-NADP reductase
MLVKQIRSETPRVVTLTLTDPGGGALPHWEPGAHIELVLPSGAIRQYSLCGDDQDKASYRIAVLHEGEGRGGSREVHTTALVGKDLAVRGPHNHFALGPAERYLLVAGGIGVTPILAMARGLERTGKAWRAVYCGHSGSMALSDELSAVNADRVTIVETDKQGRPDLAALIDGAAPGTAVYVCGPAPLIAAVRQLCEEADPPLPVRCERFAADPAARPADPTGDGPFEVEMARSGTTVTVAAGQTILDAVREVCPGVPFSCEEGYCGTCETRVLDGVPDHRDDVLSAVEHERSATMMICVGRSKTPRLTLDI